jgi:hypothetical protein
MTGRANRRDGRGVRAWRDPIPADEDRPMIAPRIDIIASDDMTARRARPAD